jgi:hypothetical protein
MRGLRGIGIGGMTMGGAVIGGGSSITLHDYIVSLGPIAYWPLDELVGVTAINYGSIVSGNGTYTGVTLNQIDAPGGTRAGLFDGVNDGVHCLSANLISAFNGTAGSFFCFAKVYTPTVWGDGTYNCITRLSANGSNFIYARTKYNAIAFQYLYNAGGTLEAFDFSTTESAWFLATITWSDAADQVKFYFNNVVINNTGIGTWSGALAVADIGIDITGDCWYGYLAHAPIFDRVLTPTEIANVITLGGI